jgi:DNA-binding transcriptional regulator YdaS (Cro superfamily)
MSKKRDTALLHALKVAGGVTVVAEELGLSKQAVSQWDQCPAEHVLKLEELTRGVVTRYRLRPDVFGRAAA